MAIGVVLVAPSGAKSTVGTALEHGTNNEAEYLAAIRALEGALACGARHVALFGDSRLVVNQIAGKWGVGAPNLVPYHQRAVAAVRRLASCNISWIPREQNSEADELSSRALAGGDIEARRHFAKYVELREAAPGIYIVEGEPALYAVDAVNGSCSCPDFQRYGRKLGACKHLFAARNRNVTP